MSFANVNASNEQPILGKAFDHDGLRRTQTVITDRTLTAADSGSLLLLADNTAAGAATTITLPAAKAGLHFEFLCTSDSITYDVAIVAATADTIYGQIFCVDDTAANIGVGVSAADQVLLDISATELQGDRATFFCDGTNWHVQAYSTTTVVWVASG